MVCLYHCPSLCQWSDACFLQRSVFRYSFHFICINCSTASLCVCLCVCIFMYVHAPNLPSMTASSSNLVNILLSSYHHRIYRYLLCPQELWNLLMPGYPGDKIRKGHRYEDRNPVEANHGGHMLWQQLWMCLCERWFCRHKLSLNVHAFPQLWSSSTSVGSKQFICQQI